MPSILTTIPTANRSTLAQDLSNYQELFKETFSIIPIGENKTPLVKNWNNLEKPITKSDLFALNGKLKAIAILLKDQYLAIDIDGNSALQKLQEFLSESGQKLTPTFAVSSGREGHFCYIYKLPESHQNRIELIGEEARHTTSKFGSIATDKNEQLEFRSNQNQIIAGLHPDNLIYQRNDILEFAELTSEFCKALERWIRDQPASTFDKSKPSLESVLSALEWLDAIGHTRFNSSEYNAWLNCGRVLFETDSSDLGKKAWVQLSLNDPSYIEEKNGKVALLDNSVKKIEYCWQKDFSLGKEEKVGIGTLVFCLKELESIEEHKDQAKKLLRGLQPKQATKLDPQKIKDIEESVQIELMELKTFWLEAYQKEDYSRYLFLDLYHGKATNCRLFGGSFENKIRAWEQEEENKIPPSDEEIAAIRKIVDLQKESEIAFIDRQKYTLAGLNHPVLNYFFDFFTKQKIDLGISLLSFATALNTSRVANSRIAFHCDNSETDEHLTDEFPCALFFCLIGNPGSGKSYLVDLFTRSLMSEQRDNNKQTKQAKKDHQLRIEELLEAKKEGRITEDELDELNNSTPPKLPTLVSKEATKEGLYRAFVDQPFGCIYVSAELAETATHMGASDSGSSKGSASPLASFILGYDNSVILENRKTAEETQGSLDFGALVGVQPALFRNIFNPKDIGQGVESRFLFADLPNRPATKKRGITNLSKTEAIAQRKQQQTKSDIEKLLGCFYKVARSLCPGSAVEPPTFDIALMESNPVTALLLEKQEVSIERANAYQNPYSIACRRLYNELLPRIAVSIHILLETARIASSVAFLEHWEEIEITEEKISTEVSDQAVQIAFDLCHWQEYELHKIYSGAVENKAIAEDELNSGENSDLLQYILQYIQKHPEGIDKRSILRRGRLAKAFPQNRGEEVQKLLNLLLNSGRVEYIESSKIYRLSNLPPIE